MKYEYTNGNESEFNGAPGWAKLAISDGHSNAFCNELDYMATAVWSNGRQFKIANPTKFTIVGVRNLISEESAWNGEGLPPVGCECEFNAYDRGWEKCVVLYVSEYTVLLSTNRASDPEEAFIPGDIEFRPIRSEANKKRDAAILAMASSPNPCGYAIAGICGELYDAIAAGKIPGVKLED